MAEKQTAEMTKAWNEKTLGTDTLENTTLEERNSKCFPISSTLETAETIQHSFLSFLFWELK